MRWQLPDLNISTRLGKNGQNPGVYKLYFNDDYQDYTMPHFERSRMCRLYPVHEAAREGKIVEIRQYLIDNSSEFNELYEYTYFTPLMFAIHGNHIEVVDEILRAGERGIDIGLDKHAQYLLTNYTILDLAAQFAGKEIFSQVILAKEWRHWQLESAFNYLLQRGNVHILRIFLDKNQDWDLCRLKPSISTNSAFHLYCRFGRLLGEYKNKTERRAETYIADREIYLPKIKQAIEKFNQSKSSYQDVISELKMNNGKYYNSIVVERLNLINNQLKRAMEQKTSFSFLVNVLSMVPSSFVFAAISCFFSDISSFFKKHFAANNSPRNSLDSFHSPKNNVADTQTSAAYEPPPENCVLGMGNS